ncbi:helix-turn-helix domain-containing protein [Pseudomonas luteola]
MLPNPNARNFSEALRAARKTAGMTQSQLSTAAGFYSGMVGLYERRVHRPDADSWMKLNKVLFPEAEITAPTEMPEDDEVEVMLKEASVEEILEELTRRGFSKVTLSNA